MANISTYLTKIMAAIYGEEVRSSIHDAISAINDESAQAASDASKAKDSAAQSASAAASSASAAASSASSANSAKTAAQAAQSIAESAKTAAAASASAALQSEKNSSTSETNAKRYAQDAQTALDSVDDVLAIKTSLEKYHAIYQDLTDSDESNLLDSGGNRIQGRVLFADVEDIVNLRKTVSALETCLKAMISLILNGRVTQLENGLVGTNDLVSILREHALLDDTFIKEGIRNG